MVDARKIVQQKAISDKQRAREIIKAVDKKACNYAKRVFFKAIKEIQWLRREGPLLPVLITDSKGTRIALRGY